MSNVTKILHSVKLMQMQMKLKVGFPITAGVDHQIQQEDLFLPTNYMKPSLDRQVHPCP